MSASFGNARLGSLSFPGNSEYCLSMILPILALSAVVCEQKAPPRVLMNDDAQVLGEAPARNTSAFVTAWLDREADFIPFTTFVFLAATPDVCTYRTRVGEAYQRSPLPPPMGH